jgi:sugar lactone lactonase YvrE
MLMATALGGLLGAVSPSCDVRDFEDRTTAPKYDGSAMELVLETDKPAGNISASRDGRLFMSFFQEGKPVTKVAEIVNGVPVPYPSADFQKNFDTVLSVRVDDQGRLWTLDNGNIGMGQPKLYAFDLATGAVVHEFAFPKAIAPKDSLLNDMQIDLDTNRIFITDTSPLFAKPGLVAYDIAGQRARRILEGHPSVVGEKNRIRVNGEPFTVVGVSVIFNADSIAIDEKNEWLYFAPFTSGRLFRAKAATLGDFGKTEAELEAAVEVFANKTMSDGISLDKAGNVYITDPEHSAVNLLEPNGRLSTLFKDKKLRWPDGFSYAPDGYMYLTTSALNEVFFQSAGTVAKAAPYQIYRFKPEAEGLVGR